MLREKQKNCNETGLRGAVFFHKFLGEEIKFTVTRDWNEALRVRINDSIQAIWLPKCCLYIDESGIRAKNIDWKLKRKEFKHKLNLAKNPRTYDEVKE